MELQAMWSRVETWPGLPVVLPICCVISGKALPHPGLCSRMGDAPCPGSGHRWGSPEPAGRPGLPPLPEGSSPGALHSG